MARDYKRLFDLGLGGGARTDAEMDLEIETHLAMRTADLVRNGWSPDAARAEAIRRFASDAARFDDARHRLHGAARQRESSLRQRDHFGSIAADVRYAARQARRTPGFTALAVAALAIGIGATTTIFTLVDHVVLRPLPFPHAEQLVRLTSEDSAHRRIETVSSADWREWASRSRAGTVTASAIYSIPFRQSIVTTDSATRINGERVSGAFFDVLGARFVAGRSFTEVEAQNRETLVVISERLWRRMFGGDPRLSVPLRTSVRAYQIVGVVADGQSFPAETDVWFPVAVGPEPAYARNDVNWLAIARLRPGATAAQARADLTTAARAIRMSDPTALYDYGVGVENLTASVVGDASTYLAMLMGVVTLVLLIVCANVAAVGLARSAARAREMAIRASLGAQRGRLLQQLLIEHVWLGLLGGGLGLFLAWAAVHALLGRWGGQIPRAGEVSLDTRVFLFALGASLMAGILAGTVPAWRSTRVSLSGVMASGSRTSARGGRSVAGASLAGAEIALALLLLTGAGLLVRSFRAVMGRDIGFDINVATAEVALGGPRYATDTLRRYAYWNSLIDAYRSIPGVQAAAVTQWIPLGLTGQGFIDIADHDVRDAAAVYRTVSEDYFRALSMPLARGRTFDSQDGASTMRVAVINRHMAATYWPGEDPVGKRVRAVSLERRSDGRPADWLTIVGVVGDVRTYGLETDVRSEMYVLFRQTPGWTTGMTALVRGSEKQPASRLLAEMRRRARGIDPYVPVDVGTLEDRLRATLSTRVLTMSLLTSFAAIAMVLAALGVYGVLSYAVAQRARELAVRSALGASQRQLLSMMFGRGLRVVAAGMSAGIVASLWLTRALESMLVDVSRLDPVAYVGAVVLLMAVSGVAVLVPSLRATRSDPVVALQAE